MRRGSNPELTPGAHGTLTPLLSILSYASWDKSLLALALAFALWLRTDVRELSGHLGGLPVHRVAAAVGYSLMLKVKAVAALLSWSSVVV